MLFNEDLSNDEEYFADEQLKSYYEWEDEIKKEIFERYFGINSSLISKFISKKGKFEADDCIDTMLFIKNIPETKTH